MQPVRRIRTPSLSRSSSIEQAKTTSHVYYHVGIRPNAAIGGATCSRQVVARAWDSWLDPHCRHSQPHCSTT